MMSRGVMVNIRGFEPLEDSSNLSGTARIMYNGDCGGIGRHAAL